jgi:hypothetical protein
MSGFEDVISLPEAVARAPEAITLGQASPTSAMPDDSSGSHLNGVMAELM